MCPQHVSFNIPNFGSAVTEESKERMKGTINTGFGAKLIEMAQRKRAGLITPRSQDRNLVSIMQRKALPILAQLEERRTVKDRVHMCTTRHP